MPRDTRGKGRISIIKNKEKIMELFNQGFTVSSIYDEIDSLHVITRRTYYYHIKKLIPEILEKNVIASSDNHEEEKTDDKKQEETERLTTKQKLKKGLLKSSDEPSFVHNPVPDPSKLL